MIKDQEIVQRYLDFLNDLKEGKVTIYNSLKIHKIHSHVYDSLKNMNLIQKDESGRYHYIGVEPTIDLARKLKNNLNSTIVHKYGKKKCTINSDDYKLNLATELQILFKKQGIITKRINDIISQLNKTI